MILKKIRSFFKILAIIAAIGWWVMAAVAAYGTWLYFSGSGRP